MPIGNSGTIDEREHEKIDSELCYSPSLEAAVKLILGDPAFVGERETPSFKFIRAARFLKDNAPHVFRFARCVPRRRTAWTVGSGTCWTRNIGASFCLPILISMNGRGVILMIGPRF
jgi:hypothetical protein